MTPLPVSSLYTVSYVQKTKDIKEGDVVMFRIDEDTRVCHRAVAIDAEGNITTKGDNNEKADDDILIKVYHLFHETASLATSGNSLITK